MWNCNDIINIKYAKDRSFFVEFDDGQKGEVNFEDLPNKGPIFEPLRDLEFFKKATLQGGTLSWPNGADIAPETIYEKL